MRSKKAGKAELAFVRRRRSWTRFGMVAMVFCCVTTVHITLVVGGRSFVAKTRRKVRATDGRAQGGREKMSKV